MTDNLTPEELAARIAAIEAAAAELYKAANKALKSWRIELKKFDAEVCIKNEDALEAALAKFKAVR